MIFLSFMKCIPHSFLLSKQCSCKHSLKISAKVNWLILKVPKYYSLPTLLAVPEFPVTMPLLPGSFFFLKRKLEWSLAYLKASKPSNSDLSPRCITRRGLKGACKLSRTPRRGNYGVCSPEHLKNSSLVITHDVGLHCE